MKNQRLSSRHWFFSVFLCFGAVTLFAGCAGPAGVDTSPIFFPPAPNPPRIQYLTSFDDATDIEGDKQSFALFVLGGAGAEKVLTIGKPYGVYTHKGKIYACDIGWSDVLIIDPVKKSFTGLKGNFNMGKLKKPVAVTLDNDDNMYVADTARREVVVFNAAGDFIGAFGKELEMKPAALAVDDKHLYVLDLANGDIKVLDRKKGKLVRSLGKSTETEKGLWLPTAMAMTPKGIFYVTNIGSAEVIKLDRDGHIISSFGGLGDIIGKFVRPRGIAVDDEGRIFVVDGGVQNVQVFNAEHRLLGFFGDSGKARGTMNLPTGVAVTRDNLDIFQSYAAPGFKLSHVIIVANQYGKDKLAIYGLGHMAGAEYEPERK